MGKLKSSVKVEKLEKVLNFYKEKMLPEDSAMLKQLWKKTRGKWHALGFSEWKEAFLKQSTGYKITVTTTKKNEK